MMKRIYLLSLFFFTSLFVSAQTYLISTGGTVNDVCSGNFYDSGGSGGAYTNNENYTMTFCAPAGQCLSANITLLDLRNNDILTIYDGSSIASPVAYTCNGCNVAGTLLSTSGCLTFRFTSNGSTVDPGWNIGLTCVPCPIFHSGTTTTTCSANYYDNGGLNNYPNNTNSLQVICPSTAGEYVSLNFSSFNLENQYDYMIIHNGNDPGGDVLGVYTGATSPGTVTSSAADGCLAIRFYADGVGPAAGWVATSSCTPTPGAPGSGVPQDCAGGGGTTICSNASFTANSAGFGANELPPVPLFGTPFPWAGCLLSGERQSSWYYFSPATSGTIEFTINPTVAEDYDFAIWGPNTDVSCPTFTGSAPIRCSYAAGTTATGLGNGAVDLSEGSGGNGWVAPLNVLAGEVYVMVISNFTASGNPFTLDWTLTNGASLDCTPLPIKLNHFNAFEKNQKIYVEWSTQVEINNDYFTVERSKDGLTYEVVGMVNGKGNSSVQNLYNLVDSDPYTGISYYRLKQTDFNGNFEYFDPIAVNVKDNFNDVSVYPNPVNGNAFVSFSSKNDVEQILSIQDVAGRIVYQKLVVIGKGNNKINLEITSFSKGMYFVKMGNNEDGFLVKFIKE
jgi:hypothetical protein